MIYHTKSQVWGSNFITEDRTSVKNRVEDIIIDGA